MAHHADRPTRICAFCGRPFQWRRKWKAVWEEVRYCSNRCRNAARRPANRSPTATSAGDAPLLQRKPDQPTG